MKGKYLIIPALLLAAGLMVVFLAGEGGLKGKQEALPANGASLIAEVTLDNIEKEIAGARVPVFIEFYATWCGPCKEQEPIIQKLALEYKGKIKFVRIDCDKSPVLVDAYGIKAVPTHLIYRFDTGKIVCRHEGLMSEDAMRAFIEKGLIPPPPPPKPKS